MCVLGNLDSCGLSKDKQERTVHHYTEINRLTKIHVLYHKLSYKSGGAINMCSYKGQLPAFSLIDEQH